ncbi:isoleucyl-tRNA synthetase [Bacillus sp. SG-1]|nr:isoleucyl-tRNA synthetase [Bacillus sp. SG-1]
MGKKLFCLLGWYRGLAFSSLFRDEKAFFIGLFLPNVLRAKESITL